jgi:hypothetical protein
MLIHFKQRVNVTEHLKQRFNVTEYLKQAKTFLAVFQPNPSY